PTLLQPPLPVPHALARDPDRLGHLGLGAALGQQLGRAQPAGLSRLRPLHRLHRAGTMLAPGHGSMLPDRTSRRHSTYENLNNGSLLIRAAGRGGVGGHQPRRQAAVGAAGAALLVTTTASSAPARCMGSARPALLAAPPATSSFRLVRRGWPVACAPRAAVGAACGSGGAGRLGWSARKACQQK